MVTVLVGNSIGERGDSLLKTHHLVPVPQTLSIKHRNCVGGIKTAICGTHPLRLIPTESTRSRCSLPIGDTTRSFVFWGKKEVLIPFPSRHSPASAHASRSQTWWSKYRVPMLLNPCASVTEAVSAISYQRRRKLATFPRLHNEEQGDVQDRQRVPGSDAFRQSGSDGSQPTGRDKPCVRSSDVYISQSILKNTETHILYSKNTH